MSIIEDEKAALRNLKAVINEVSAGLEIIGETDSIVDTIEWFQTHPMPELVFMDIHRQTVRLLKYLSMWR